MSEHTSRMEDFANKNRSNPTVRGTRPVRRSGSRASIHTRSGSVLSAHGDVDQGPEVVSYRSEYSNRYWPVINPNLDEDDQAYNQLINRRTGMMDSINRYSALGIALKISELHEELAIFDWANELRVLLGDGELSIKTIIIISRCCYVLRTYQKDVMKILRFACGMPPYGNYWETSSQLIRKMLLFTSLAVLKRPMDPDILDSMQGLLERCRKNDVIYPTSKLGAMVYRAGKTRRNEDPGFISREAADTLYDVLSDKLDEDTERDYSVLARHYLMGAMDGLKDKVHEEAQFHLAEGMLHFFDNVMNTAVAITVENSRTKKKGYFYDGEDGFPVPDLIVLCRLETDDSFFGQYQDKQAHMIRNTRPLRQVGVRKASHTRQAGKGLHGEFPTIDETSREDDDRGGNEGNQTFVRRENPVHENAPAGGSKTTRHHAPSNDPQNVHGNNQTPESSELVMDPLFAGKYFGPISAGDTTRSQTEFLVYEINDSSLDIYLPGHEPTVVWTNEEDVTVNSLPGIEFNKRLKYGLWIAPMTTGYVKFCGLLTEATKSDQTYEKHAKCICACMIAAGIALGHEVVGGKVNVFNLSRGIESHQNIIRSINEKFTKELVTDKFPGKGRDVIMECLPAIFRASSHAAILSVIVGCYTRQGHLNASAPFPARRFEEEFSTLMKSWVNQLCKFYEGAQLAASDNKFSSVEETPNSWPFLIKRMMLEHLWDNGHISYAVRYFHDERSRNAAGLARASTGRNRFDVMSPPSGLAEFVSSHAVLSAMSSSISSLFDKKIQKFLDETRKFQRHGLWRFRFSSLSLEVIGLESLPIRTDTTDAFRLAGSMVEWAATRDPTKEADFPVSRVFSAMSLRTYSTTGYISQLKLLFTARSEFLTTLSKSLGKTKVGQMIIEEGTEQIIESFGVIHDISASLKRKRDQDHLADETVHRPYGGRYKHKGPDYRSHSLRRHGRYEDDSDDLE